MDNMEIFHVFYRDDEKNELIHLFQSDSIDKTKNKIKDFLLDNNYEAPYWAFWNICAGDWRFNISKKGINNFQKEAINISMSKK